MDKNLPGINGIESARKILKDYPEAHIVIITGEPDWFSRLPEIEELGCGLSIKPINKKEIEQIILNASIGNLSIRTSSYESNHIQNMKKDEVIWKEPLSQIIKKILFKSEYNLGADVTAIFSIDLRTYQVELVASSKDISEKYNKDLKYNLIYSPIKDVILDNMIMIENDVRNSFEKFKHLIPLTVFRSFMGIPIKTSTLAMYGLFYFYQEPYQFKSNEHIPKARLIAEFLRLTIEKKLLEDQIDISQKLVFAGEMSYAFRHEIRNILSPITNDIELLKMDADDISNGKFSVSDESFKKRFIDNVNDIEQVKDKIMDSLIVFRNLMVEESEESEENINSIIYDVIHILTLDANNKKIRLKPDLDNSIPRVKISRTKLQHLFINILLNAIQWVGSYRTKGGEVIIQTCYIENDEYPIKVRFIDNGPGIHRLDWERIFDPLVTTRKGGSGMGLFVCRSLARAIKIKIFVEKSLIFFGTTFRVDIPIGGQRNV